MRTARSTAALVAAPLIALSVPVAALATAGTASAAATSDTATVSILHAVPGLTVDVYANGKELVPGFTPGTLTDPQQLPSGSYDLAVYPAGADPAATQPAISAKGVQVPAGANVTVVAHLDAAGTPALTPFVNAPAARGRGVRTHRPPRRGGPRGRRPGRRHRCSPVSPTRTRPASPCPRER